MTGSSSPTPARPATNAMLNESILPRLGEAELQAIEAAIREVGEYGEVRLIIKKSRLRFVEVVRSRSIPGCPEG